MEEVIKLKKTKAEIEKKIKQGSIRYLKKVLKKNDGRISCYIEDFCLTVPYEDSVNTWANNEFSMVDAVYLKDGKVYLAIEDSDEYEINKLNYDDVYNVAMFVYEKVLK